MLFDIKSFKWENLNLQQREIRKENKRKTELSVDMKQDGGETNFISDPE